MHDPKFEEEVQKKLEELSFSPSDAVWTRVERVVNEKRRRRIPVFWFFLLPALGLAGAGVYYFGNRNAGSNVRSTSRSNTVVRNAPKVVAAPTEAGRPNVAAPPKEVIAPEEAVTAKATVAPKELVLTIKVSEKSMKKAMAPQAPDAQEVSSGNLQTLPDNRVAISTTEKKTARPATLPGLKSFDHHFAAPTASRLATRNATTTAVKAPIKLQPKYAWEAGFTGGVGLSSLNKTLFQQPVVLSANALIAAPITSRPKDYSSAIQPDISYWAGITLERPLRKSLLMSLGLDLHYYSARVQIGEKVYADPASLNAASSLFNTSQTPRVVQAAAYPYYSVGSQDYFVNRYYFLELPVSLLWQVNHSPKLPIFWESGLSLSYLVSSNALYYNTKSNVFYKDGGSMTQKTQLNLATALLVGLPVKGLKLQVGPQVQYGLTSLQHLGSNGQHLFYGGLRVVLLPGKSKK